MDNNLQKQQSVFWIEIDKIKPNPMQPRVEFGEERLADLADSVRQYGVLQPLIVTRKEVETIAGISVEYELIAGERRLRASKMAGLYQVPVIIREDSSDKIKLELAIIENLQREDLNPIERARAFKQLIDTFNLKHHEVAKRVGRTRVYVSNSVRLLNLPEKIQQALQAGEIYEGHMSPLLMLSDHQEEQVNLFREILEKKLNVRQSEGIARQIAVERVRKLDTAAMPPHIRAIEEKLADSLGTRVRIERIGKRGKIHIEFFSDEELQAFLERVSGGNKETGFQSNPEEPTTPFESSQPEDMDELAKNFTV